VRLAPSSCEVLSWDRDGHVSDLGCLVHVHCQHALHVCGIGREHAAVLMSCCIR
jgi:hypothetical protein